MALLIMALLILGITRKSNGDAHRERHGGAVQQDGHGPVVFPDLPSREHPSDPRKSRNPHGFHRCPLCGSVLEKHEKVKSVLYPGKPDGMMEIFGCPYCYGTGAKKERICPVCAKSLPKNGMVYARFFQTADRKHAHVLGCSSCYTRR